MSREGESSRTVGILGATGLIGGHLATHLAAAGDRVVRFSRNPPEGEDGWRSARPPLDLAGLDAVVNLAGESVAQRWTPAARERIRRSRIDLTTEVVDAIGRLAPPDRPRTLVNASASGYYAPGGDHPLPEDAAAGSDFLAGVCRDWEAAAGAAERHGVRVVAVRTGIVLGSGGDAWERMRRLFSLGLGGPLGTGRQFMPWIHLEDEVRAIEFALGNPELRGPVNLGAPEPVRNREFTRELGKVLRRPAILPVPGFALKIVLGEFAGSVLASYRMIPEKLEAAGFEFRFRRVPEALAALCE
ncbi:MAG: TIGR01777 family protein [Akkermansiaceae bacterium]|nr:TIGR01777 family protein [Akkermansiaceae bacterium]